MINSSMFLHMLAIKLMQKMMWFGLLGTTMVLVVNALINCCSKLYIHIQSFTAELNGWPFLHFSV